MTHKMLKRFIASPQQGPLPVGCPSQVVAMETNQDSIAQGSYSQSSVIPQLPVVTEL